MKMRTAVLAVVVMIPAVAFAMGQHDTYAQGQPQANDVKWNALMAGMNKMHVAMASTRPSGDANVDFVRLMLPHHEAALDMAKTQLIYGTDPQMRRLAQEIITDQQSEIELMQLWLKQHEDHHIPAAYPTK
ncbi:MAG TPA: DUF305 domain-containing protein [Acidisarcina sp.]